jgi:hypothetical protein
VNSLGDDELRDPYQAMRRTLRAAVRNRRIPSVAEFHPRSRSRSLSSLPNHASPLPDRWAQLYLVPPLPTSAKNN